MYSNCWCGHTYFNHATLMPDPSQDSHYYSVKECQIEMCGCGQYDTDDSDYNINVMKYKKLSPFAKEPSKVYEGDACFDLYADGDFIVKGNDTVKVTTGIALEIPEGYEVVVRSRSSSFSKKGLWVHMGTIDEQYRGEVYFFVNLIAPIVTEVGQPIGLVRTQDIKQGEAVAQMAIREVPQFRFEEVDELSESERGSKGFGSTG